MPDPAASPGPCSHRPPPRSKRHENLSCISPAASGSSSGVLDVLAGSRLAPCMLLRFFSPLSSQGLQLLSTFLSSADTCWLPHTAVLLKRATLLSSPRCCFSLWTPDPRKKELQEFSSLWAVPTINTPVLSHTFGSGQGRVWQGAATSGLAGA